MNTFGYCPDPVGHVDPYGLQQHTLSCDFTPGGSNETFVPTSNSGRNGPNGRPVPGFTSGSTNDDYQRARAGQPAVPATTRAVAGAQGSNGSCGRTGDLPLVANRDRGNSHSEQHALEWARTHFPNNIPGSTMNMGGQNPPCAMCHHSMQEFTNTHPPATVNYNWPVNNHVQYHGGQGPTPMPHQPGAQPGAEAVRLQQAANGQLGPGGYRAEYQRQMDDRTRPVLRDGTPNPTYNPALADRTHHTDPLEAQHERNPDGSPRF
jgi:hypothetical protein